MVLLDMLRRLPGLTLVVAHFDHGIRPDSAEDRRLVEAYAKRHGLAFVHDRAELGNKASEAAARKARYDFLRKVKAAVQADAIILAHHRDDVLETALINLLRGTDRRGLSSLRSQGDIFRPLLHLPKRTLREYATQHGITWREDSTNKQTRYLRNRIRHDVLGRADARYIRRLGELVDAAMGANQAIDELLISLLHQQPAADRLDRRMFVKLPHKVARELMAAWLRHRGVGGYDRPKLERLVTAAKTLQPGKRIPVAGRTYLLVGKHDLALMRSDR